MSGVAIINHMLSNSYPLAAVVDESKIITGTVPLNTILPAISIRHITESEFKFIKRTGTQLVTERVQVTVLAPTYTKQDEIIELVRNAVTSSRTTINTFLVDSITHDIVGPDLHSEDPETYEKSIDFIVRFNR